MITNAIELHLLIATLLSQTVLENSVFGDNLL
jgi:hypothetical protein